MYAAGKFLIDASLNGGWNILWGFQHSAAEGVVPRHANALRQPHRSLLRPMGTCARDRFDPPATPPGNDRYFSTPVTSVSTPIGFDPKADP